MGTHEKPEKIPAELVMAARKVIGCNIMTLKQFLVEATPELYSRFVESVQMSLRASEGTETHYRGMLVDPILLDPEYGAIACQVRDEAYAQVRAEIIADFEAEFGKIDDLDRF